MISFFRKIRQKLLSQNRVTRFLINGFVEIPLFMIGIVIPLRVNSRKLKKQKAFRLENLQQNFKGIWGKTQNSFDSPDARTEFFLMLKQEPNA